MMILNFNKLRTLLLGFFIISFSLTAQKRSPTLVVLNARNTSISNDLDSIAKIYYRESLSEKAKEAIRKENGEKFKLKAEKEIEFLESANIFSNITYGLNFFLSFKFFEYYQNLLIFPAKEKHNSSLVDLELIADKYNVNWVLDIKSIRIYKESYKHKGKVSYQLYNQKSNKILLSKTINVDDRSNGFEFTCEAGTIECVINNIIRGMYLEIFSYMNSNKRYWR